MVGNLLFKVVISPSLVGLASLASRRWGEAIGGWLVALPLTAGPVVFFLAIDQGPLFARSAALGCLAGGLAQASSASVIAGAHGGFLGLSLSWLVRSVSVPWQHL